MKIWRKSLWKLSTRPWVFWWGRVGKLRNIFLKFSENHQFSNRKWEIFSRKFLSYIIYGCSPNLHSFLSNDVNSTCKPKISILIIYHVFMSSITRTSITTCHHQKFSQIQSTFNSKRSIDNAAQWNRFHSNIWISFITHRFMELMESAACTTTIVLTIKIHSQNWFLLFFIFFSRISFMNFRFTGKFIHESHSDF